MRDFNIEKNPAQINHSLHLGNIIRKVLSIFLGAQSLYGLYESIKFILFDRTEIETAINENQLDVNSINLYIAKTVVTAFSTFSLLFAAILFGAKGSVNKNMQIIIGIVLIIANVFLMNFVSQLGIFEQIAPLIDFS